MTANNSQSDHKGPEQLIAEARRQRAEREKDYRAQALKMYPHICGRCGREFAGKKLRELTVHHRDHNHDNNPADGSNWELLCLYCHDNEHQKFTDEDSYAKPEAGTRSESPGTFKPFASLRDVLEDKKNSQ